MPPILSVGCTPDPMLDVIVASGARLLPSCLGGVAIIGMDGRKPTHTNALRKCQAGEDGPLRAWPGALAAGFRAENKLGNIGREDAEQLLALPKLFLSKVLAGAVAQDLDKTSAAVGQRHQQPRRPEARLVLAHL